MCLTYLQFLYIKTTERGPVVCGNESAQVFCCIHLTIPNHRLVVKVNVWLSPPTFVATEWLDDKRHVGSMVEKEVLTIWVRCVAFSLWDFIPQHQYSRVVTVQNTNYTSLLAVYSASTSLDKLNNSNHSTSSYWIHHSYWLSWQLWLYNRQYFLCRWCTGKTKVGIWHIWVHTYIRHLRIFYCQWTWLKKLTQAITVSFSSNPSFTSTGSMAHAGPRATTWLISRLLYPQLFFSSL